MNIIRLFFLIFAATVVLLENVDAQEQPQVRKRIDPKYPAILKEAGIEGEVSVKVTVNEKGKVEKAEAVTASNPDFIPATLEAVKQWEFTPATDNGKPITAEVTVPFRFRLKGDSYKSGYEDIFRLKEDAERILRGEMTDRLRSFVDAEAHVVMENHFELLRPLLADTTKASLLVEGRKTNIEWSRLISNDEKTSAYLILKTKPTPETVDRFHTIVFMRDSAKEWKLVTWHVSQ